MTAEELVRISKSKDFMSLLGKINRWDLLPALFRVKGKPFSLEGREQFSVLFSPEIVRETIVMSGRQLGKSMSLSRSEGYDVASVDNLQILYVAPLQEQTRRYSDLYFSEAIRSCPLLQTLQKPAMLDIRPHRLRRGAGPVGRRHTDRPGIAYIFGVGLLAVHWNCEGRGKSHRD